MGMFQQSQLTAYGANRLNATQQGDRILFTTIAFGDGFLGDDLSTVENLANEVIRNPVITRTLENNIFSATSRLQNSGGVNGFYLREMGLYVADIGHEQDRAFDKLYAVCKVLADNLGDYYIYIPATTEASMLVDLLPTINTLVSPDAEVVINVDSGTVGGIAIGDVMRAGTIITQYPGQRSPADIWPELEWRDITWAFADSFFRVEGKNSLPFEGGVQNEAVPDHNHSQVEHSHVLSLMLNTGSANMAQRIGGAGTQYATDGAIRPTAATNNPASQNNPIYGRRAEVAPVNETIKLWRRVGAIINDGAKTFYIYDINGNFVDQIELDQDEAGFIGFNPNIMTQLVPTVWPSLGRPSIPYDIISNANARWGFRVIITDDAIIVDDLNTAYGGNYPTILRLPYRLDRENRVPLRRQLLSLLVAPPNQTPIEYAQQDYAEWSEANMTVLGNPPASKFRIAVDNRLSRAGNIEWQDKSGATCIIAQNAYLETLGVPANALLNFTPTDTHNAEIGFDAGRVEVIFTLPALVGATGVTVTADKNFIDIGETIQATAILAPAGALGNVVWTSVNENVATVDSNGLVTATGSGTVTIRATVGGLTGDLSITVREDQFVAPPPTALTIATTNSTLPINGQVQFTKALTPANTIANGTYTWTSSDTAIATVDNNGLVTGVGTGTTDIRATYTFTNGSGGQQLLQSGITIITVNTSVVPPPATQSNSPTKEQTQPNNGFDQELQSLKEEAINRLLLTDETYKAALAKLRNKTV
jgi:hypothetical protein